MQSRRLHRLSRFRRNKRRLRDRLRQRIFFGEDKETPETMEKPRVVVLTGAGISAERGQPSGDPYARRAAEGALFVERPGGGVDR